MKTRQTPSFALTRSAILLSLATCLTLPQLTSAAPILPAPDRASSNPGAELNRAREYMERQRVLRQIQEDQASRKEKVQGAEEKPFDADANRLTINSMDTGDIILFCLLPSSIVDRARSF